MTAIPPLIRASNCAYSYQRYIRLLGHRRTDERYLIICDRSEKLERPTVKPLSGMPHSSGKKKIMFAAQRGIFHCGWKARNAAVFGRKFAKSFPSFRKVRIAKLRMISTETTMVPRDEDSKEDSRAFPSSLVQNYPPARILSRRNLLSRLKLGYHAKTLRTI